jgi:hypothetical protein
MQTPLGAEQLRHQVPHTQSLSVPMHTVQQINIRNTQGEVMSIIRFIKEFWCHPTPQTLALRELEESKRELLTAHTNQEYSLKMVEYHRNKIKRLTAFLKEKS